MKSIDWNYIFYACKKITFLIMPWVGPVLPSYKLTYLTHCHGHGKGRNSLPIKLGFKCELRKCGKIATIFLAVFVGRRVPDEFSIVAGGLRCLK